VTEGRSPTSVDLAAFAPDICGYGHSMGVGSGNRRVGTFPCSCAGIRGDEQGRLFHVWARCTACQSEGRKTVFYDPEHAEEL
jgi:hypothetical protein